MTVEGDRTMKGGSHVIAHNLVGGGAIYFVLFLYGLFVDHGAEANFVPLNDADNWLHLGLSIAMIAAGLLTRDKVHRDGR